MLIHIYIVVHRVVFLHIRVCYFEKTTNVVIPQRKSYVNTEEFEYPSYKAGVFLGKLRMPRLYMYDRD